MGIHYLSDGSPYLWHFEQCKKIEPSEAVRSLSYSNGSDLMAVIVVAHSGSLEFSTADKVDSASQESPISTSMSFVLHRPEMTEIELGLQRIQQVATDYKLVVQKFQCTLKRLFPEEH